MREVGTNKLTALSARIGVREVGTNKLTALSARIEGERSRY